MQRYTHPFILAAFILIVGCHSNNPPHRLPDPDSGDTENSSSVPPTNPAALSSRTHENMPLLVCYGDSLTAGFGAEAGQSYPDFLQADLDAAGYHYHVVNEGVSGATSKDGLVRLAGIVAMKPAVVVVEFGGNDGLRGLPIKDLRANLDTIVTSLKAGGAKVALAGMTLPPDYGPDYVSQFTASYPLLAKKNQVPVLPFLLQGVYGGEGMMQADHIHATGRGNEIVARNVLALVAPMLTK
jgi:acyl-CoA thioesterase-1